MYTSVIGHRTSAYRLHNAHRTLDCYTALIWRSTSLGSKACQFCLFAYAGLSQQLFNCGPSEACICGVCLISEGDSPQPLLTQHVCRYMPKLMWLAMWPMRPVLGWQVVKSGDVGRVPHEKKRPCTAGEAHSFSSWQAELACCTVPVDLGGQTAGC